jgi:RND family efflux transporter MFP subunit
MKRVLFLLLALALLPAGISAAQQLYTCGMHPQVIRNEPGNCPICGMKLTPIRDNAGTGGTQITIDAGTIQRMNLKTAPVETGPVERTIRAVGTIDFDETGLRDITTKYEGWLEKLHVNASWTAVRTGDPLFDIYSPELYNAQLNYLVARRNELSGEGPLTTAALERMRLFDLPETFIAELRERGTAQRTYTFRAPADGVVIEKMAVEGQMMKPGEVIYRLADMSTVWVHAQIYESDLPFVREGQNADVRVTFGAEREFHGEISLLIPTLTAATRTAIARIPVENTDGFLRPGMFTDIRFVSRLEENAVLVPDTAVLRSGERNTVFIALDDGMFEPREVTLGPRTIGDRYHVLSGLEAGERVVVSGQFLLDSESQLREAIQKMLPGSSLSPGGHNHGTDAMPGMGATETPAAGNTPVETFELPPGTTLYTCPMANHAEYVYDQPGKCEACEMTLVPTSSVKHGAKSEAAWRVKQAHAGHEN